MNSHKKSNEAFTCKEALSLLLDNVGFDQNACRFMDPVGACIPKEVLPICRAAIEKEESAPSASSNPGSPKLPTWEVVEKECDVNCGPDIIANKMIVNTSKRVYEFICRQQQAGA